MKLLIFAFLCLSLSLANLHADQATASPDPVQTGQPDVPAPTPYQIIDRGANHKVWQSKAYVKLPNGQTVLNSREYVEMASGMHYKDANGNWTESKEVIQPFAGGAIAQQGQYQVTFANNLNSAGAIDQQTPDGKRLRSNILGLAYYDSSSGQSVMIAQVQDSPGELIAANQVLYTNAFEGVKADVRYTYKKGSFEQDVILREQPPMPESLGLNPDSTEVQVLTEFINPPDLVAPRIQNVAPVEQDISWGAMRLGSGKAFDLDNPPTSGRLVTVDRQYTTLDGRNILVERVPLHNIQASLSKLPLQASLNVRRPLFASKQLALPKTPSTTTVKAPLKLAVNSSSNHGYVLDYIELNSDQDDITFQADMTYYISDVVNIDGTAIFEGGSVIKFDTSVELYLGLNGPGICESGPNRPVIFTSQNDDTVGQAISHSDPSLVYYWTGLAGAGSDNVYWHDVRFKYAQFGMDIHSLHLSDSQFVDCLYPIVLDQATGGSLAGTNILIEHSGYAFSGSIFNAKVYQLTVNDCTNLTYDWGSHTTSVLATTNSLLVNVQAIGPGNLHTNYTARLTDSGGTILQTNGDGSAYLASGSPYRNVGTTNVGAATLADLANLTTYPPIVYSNTVFATNQTLYPQAQRDTNQLPTLGYHYPPLDYVVANATVSNNITLTLAPGTVLGWFHSSGSGSGLSLKDGANFVGAGTPSQPCWVTHTSLVQEGDGNWETVSGNPGLLFAGDNTGSLPQINCHFTKMSGQNFTANQFWDNYYHGQGNFTDCEFYNGAIAAQESNLYFTNCLLYRVATTMWGASDATTFTFQNCTFYNGEFIANRSSGQPSSFWTFRNTAFDGTAFQFSDNYSGNTAHTAFDYNSYNTDNLGWQYNTYYSPMVGTLEVAGAHDVPVTDYGWQTSWFGNFYLPPGSSLLNVGSTNANQVQLYHFTTQTNQVPETNSRVDIGYHYVATDAFGNPLDINSNGIPDYLEDANGDGLVDNGESNWALAILSQPINQTAYQGSNVVLSVVAAGASPLTYQWYSTNSGTLFGATNAALLFNNVQFSEAGLYYVVVANAYGTIASSNAYLTVLAPPSITLQPTNQTVMTGSNVTFSAIASGTTPLAYQWYGTSSGILANATNSSFTLTNVQLTNADNYFVVVTNLYGIVSSTNALLAVLAPPVITLQPVNQTVTAGSTAAFGVTATGTTNLSFQWYGASGGILPGATNSVLPLLGVQVVNTDNYFVIITNYLGSTTSSLAALSVVTAPTVLITNPLNNAAFFGGKTNITLSATATDTGGTIGQVQFFQGTTSLGIVTNPPYTVVWSNVTSGSYSLTAVAVDGGLMATSSVVNISIFSTNDIVVWLRADAITGLANNAPISSWPDGSGWNNNALSTTTGSKPTYVTNVLNGLPVVRFDGITNQLQLVNYPATNNFTAIVVARTALTEEIYTEANAPGYGDINNYQHFIFGGDLPGGFENNTGETSLSLGTNGISVFEYMIESMYGPDKDPLAVYPANIGSGFSIIGINSTNQQPSIYLNGQYVWTGLTATTPQSAMGNTIGYGSSWGGAFGGDLPEMLVFNRALSPAEHLAVDTYLNIKYAIVPSVPTVPTNLVATAVSSNQIILSWINTATNFVNGYYIERKQGIGGNFQQIATLNSVITFIDSNLTSGVVYYYRVRAFNLAGTSIYSSQASATTLSGSAPLPFADLKFWVRADMVPGQANTNLPVADWPDQSGNGYDALQSTPLNQPYWTPNSIGNLPVLHFDGTNGFFYLTNMASFLTMATQAEVFVVLRTGTNSLAVSPLWQLYGYYDTYQSYGPNTNIILEAFGSGASSAYSFASTNQLLSQFHVYNVVSQTNNWQAWINGSLLFQSTNNGFAIAQHMPPLLGCGTSITNLGFLTTNYFTGDLAEILLFDRGLTVAEKASVNNYLATKYAAALTVTPTPENLSATAISPTQIKLNWAEPLDGGATQISVERATNVSGTFSVVAQVSDTGLYDTNLAAGTTYYYRVRGVNQTYTTSNSAYSSIAQATTFTNGPTWPTPLALWLRADVGVTTNSAGLVSAWADQSANGNNATQSTSTSQPILTNNSSGNSVIHFDGTNYSLTLPAFMNGVSGAEAFVVLKATTDFPSSSHTLWQMGGDWNDTTTYPHIDGTLSDDFGSSTVQVESQGAPPQSVSQYHVYEVMSASNSWASWLNGSMLYRKSGNTVSFAAQPTLGMASSQGNSGGGYYPVYLHFAGDIAEVLVFSRTLATSERATISSYLNGKYSLVPSVPAAPTNLTATAISPTQIALTWEETNNGAATQIGIQRSLSSGSGYQQVAEIPNTTSYLDTNLSPGTTYFYKVAALNISQWSPTSNVAQASTPIIGTNLPLNSLALWLKSDAGLLQGSSNQPVNLWADQSGNGNDASQFVSGNAPIWVPDAIGDRPVVRFNGTNSYLNLPSFMNSVTGAEAFVVLKVATNYPANSQSLWQMGGDLWNGQLYPDNNGNIADDFGSAGGYNNSGVHALGVPAQPINQYYVYQVSSQPSNWSAWINGIQQFQTSTNTVSFAAQPQLGMSYSAGYSGGGYTASTYFAGDIAEILIFNRGLTTDERAAVSTYLNGKFALVPRLPSTPTNLAAVALTPTQISLTWQETLNAGATRVSIERLNTNTWTYQVVAQVTDANSYVDTNLTAGTTYYYRVRAINVDQWSAYSGAAQATTLLTGGTLPVGSLALWLKADAGLWMNSSNAPVNFWSDQSGNRNNAAQPVVQYEPLWIAGTNGGYPTILFNGTNSHFTLSSFLNGANSAEAFVVLKTATTNTFQTLWEFGGDSWDRKTYPYTDGSLNDDFGSTTNQYLGVPSQPLNQYHVYQVSSQKDDWAAWINGQLLYETPESGFNTVSFAAGMTLGGAPYEFDDGFENYQSFNYFEGNIAEVLVFNRSLTSDERTAVNGYLNGKYGLTPVVTITNPVNNALFLGSTNISIAANASDSAGIAQVQFFQGTTSLGIVTNAPYTLVWSNVQFGCYALTACATDNNGLNFTSSIVNITVAGIALTAPTNNALMVSPTNIAFTASVVDGNGISQVQYFQGTTLIGTSTSVPYSFTWNSVTSGAYALTARATDNNGLILTSSVVNVAVDVPPTVTLTNPVSTHFVAGTNINLGASASDSDGTVASVQFFQGTNLLGTKASLPYSMVWSNVPAGAYGLTACATDNSGLVSTSTVVSIQVAGIVITNPANYFVATNPLSITLGVAVTDNTSITQVQYFQGTTSIGTATTAPYSQAWNSVTTGNYVVTATATDLGGLTFTSPPVNVIVDVNPATTDQDGDGISDYIEYLEGRNPLVNGSVPDTNGVVNLIIYTPLR